MPKKPPPPDHLVPQSWLEKSGVTQEELDNWVDVGHLVKVTIHGGSVFFAFSSHRRPVKFNEVTKLIKDTRAKC